jgi:hypothetical protein
LENPYVKAALVLPVCAVLMFAATPASGSELVISTGKQGGSYHGIGLRLASALSLEHQKHLEVITSAGSLENLDRLDDPDSPVSVGLTQTDALDQYLETHPDFAGEFIVLGDVGRECVFIVARRDGTIRRSVDLADAGGRISVGDPNSGAAVTYESMIRLEPRLRSAPPLFVDIMEALLQIKVGGKHASLDAAMFVQRPLRRSPAMQTVLDGPATYRFVAITEQDMSNTQLPDGSSVYTFEKVTVGGKSRRQPSTVETLCTRGLLLGATRKLSSDQRGLLSEVMLASESRIVGEDE